MGGDEIDKVVPQSLQTQQVAAGAKATNVIMQNQQAIIQEYVSEPYIPQEVQDLRPLETMMILKRAIGNENEFDIAMNDIEYDMVSLIRHIAGPETALDMALSYIHHREGLRAKGMSERSAQVIQRSIEELKTTSASEKRGMFDRVGSFVKGGQKKPANPFAIK